MNEINEKLIKALEERVALSDALILQQSKRIEELETQLSDLREFNKGNMESLKIHESTVSLANQRILELEKALTFYADGKHFVNTKDIFQGTKYPVLRVTDRGETAQKALNQKEVK